MGKIITTFLAFLLLAPTALAQSPFQNLREQFEGVKDRFVPSGEDRQEFRQELRGEDGEKGEIRVRFREGADELRQEFELRRRELLDNQEKVREEFRTKFESVRDLPPTERDERVRELVEERRAEFRETVEQKRKEAEELREEFRKRVEERRAELQEKIREVQDERRREIAERVAENLNKVQERLLNNFLRVIDNLETVLTNISTATDRREAAGADVSAVRAAISNAETVLAEARAALELQFQEDYTPVIEEDASVGQVLSNLRNQLAEDLKSAREIVLNAKEAVRSAAVALAQVSPSEEGSEEPE